MTEKQEIMRLLEEKTTLLLQLEKITDSLYEKPLEEMQKSVEKRQSIIYNMQNIDERIQDLCSAVEPGVKEAVETKSDRGRLSQELGQIFDKAMGMKAVAFRVLKNSDTIRDRLQREYDNVHSEIEQLNRSSASVAGRYNKTVGMGYQTNHASKLKEMKI